MSLNTTSQCTNFELATHVPLIISAPTQKQKSTKSKSLVELLDIFPTLVELTGLPVPPELEGKSLAPILDNPEASVKDFAMSQFPRSQICNSKHTPLQQSPMGYTIRTELYRYTQWLKFDYNLTAPHPIWSEKIAEELYAHTGDDESSMDDFENENLASDPKYAAVLKTMGAKLRSIVGS